MNQIITATGVVTEPGLYNGVADEDYHKMRLCSATQLKMLQRGNPQHVMHWITHQQDTPALRIGRALHCQVLTPRLFKTQFAVTPNIDRRTKAGKVAYATFANLITPRQTILKQIEHDLVLSMATAVSEHQLAATVMEACDNREVVALGEINGVLCRGKMDAISDDCSLLVDLKSTATLASRHEMGHVMWKHGYGLQMCMYRELMRCNGCDPKTVTIIAVEKSPPFSVCVFEISHELLDMHIPLMDRLIDEWKQTIGSNNITGWSDKFVHLTLPKYALNELELEAEMAPITTTGGAA